MSREYLTTYDEEILELIIQGGEALRMLQSSIDDCKMKLSYIKELKNGMNKEKIESWLDGRQREIVEIIRNSNEGINSIIKQIIKGQVKTNTYICKNCDYVSY